MGSHQLTVACPASWYAMVRFSAGEMILLRLSRPPTHGLLVLAGGYQRGLVADVGYVRSGEAGGLFGQEFHVEVLHQLDLAQVYLEYLQALVLLGQVHVYLTVETACAHEGLVKDVGPVGGGQDDDSGIGAEAVHLGEELVEGVLPLVVGGETYVLAPCAAHSVYLVYEDDAGGLLLGLAEEVAHAGGSHADEHLHEV